MIAHDPLPTITANPVELTQVFQNLIGNAIKFRGPAEAGDPRRRQGKRAAGCSRSATTGSASTRSSPTGSS